MSNVVVIDNFYENPEKVRSLALQVDYRDVTQLNYPGFQSINSFSSPGLEKRFSEILGRELDNNPQVTFGKFRIMLKETASELNVHVDGHAQWTGVLYLNTPEQCRGGTAFYRHKATGLEGPPKAEQLSHLGYDKVDDFQTRIIRVDTSNQSAWSVSQMVSMRFNRLVLFRGNALFHCHTESFGSNKVDGRLTQNFFFNEKAHG
jgi:hypothetical protein